LKWALGRPSGRLEKEGFRRVFVLHGEEEIAGVSIERERAWTDRTDLHGPFDLIGDVHGCYTELVDHVELHRCPLILHRLCPKCCVRAVDRNANRDE
jgi:hypothetical protein